MTQVSSFRHYKSVINPGFTVNTAFHVRNAHEQHDIPDQRFEFDRHDCGMRTDHWEGDVNTPKSVGKALQELAEPSARGDRVKAAIERAARLSGLSYWRTFDLWYAKTRRIEDYEITAINDALLKKRATETRNELSELRLRLARLESLLVQTDPEFHRETVDLVRTQMRRSR